MAHCQFDGLRNISRMFTCCGLVFWILGFVNCFLLATFPMRNQNIDCINSKFYLFSIAIKRTHILVAMQYTMNNLYTDGTLDILNGSLKIGLQTTQEFS